MFGIFHNRYSVPVSKVIRNLEWEIKRMAQHLEAERTTSARLRGDNVKLASDGAELVLLRAQNKVLMRTTVRMQDERNMELVTRAKRDKEAALIIAAKDQIINRQDEENARLMALIKHFNIVDVEEA